MTQAAPEVYTEIITPIQGGDPLSFRMIKVEAGEFMMGSEDEEASPSEKPIHRVELSSFWIGEFPVTQALWLAIMGENPAYFPGMNRPVERVSWEDITECFLPALNQRSKQTYRLPTEAEWEYAASASDPLGNSRPSPKYANSNRLKDIAWYRENSHGETKAVGLKQPNAIGLYDMSGNVLEWCSDWFDVQYYQTCADKGIVKKIAGPSQGIARVLRGGSWGHLPVNCRVRNRTGEYTIYAGSDAGFRLVVSSWQ